MGRSTDVEGVPGDANIVYVGTAAGGVWKTVNGGTTWMPIFEKQPTLSIGDDDAVRAIFRKERSVRIREAAKPTRRSKEERRAARDAKGAVKAGFEGADAKLFEALKTWRRETAHANSVPPYVIFHDATLAEMVRAKPNTLSALGRISGIGEAKLKKYGAEVLAVLIAGI